MPENGSPGPFACPKTVLLAVRGPGQAPLYKYLTTLPKFTGQVEWNFEKFLIGRNGEVIGRFKSEVEPMSRQMAGAVESAIASR